MIEFESVSKRFPDGTVAVDDVSLVAPQGKLTVLVGPSGCGKTTSLAMVNRLVDVTSGRILVGGQDISQSDRVELRRGIGYVIQHSGLFPHRTVLDNVGTVPRLLGWDRSKIRKRSYELLEMVGLSTEQAERYPAQLSGGQQQRVGVARALASDPPVMLMDEPFSAVDPVVRSSLQDEFLRLQEQVGKTILFVTHDIDEAIKLGDRVAVFAAGGHLAQIDSPGELLAAPANEFVASFVGRDRGYRRLQFLPSDGISVGPAPTARVGERAHDGWTLAVDGDHRPLGWLAPGGDTVAEERLEPLGSTFTKTDSLRAALEAVLVSPAGLAVRLDAEGCVDGVVDHATLAEHHQASSEAADSEREPR
ncbi:ATP-binding cassette domain-containing protein [soil metagenome]